MNDLRCAILMPAARQRGGAEMLLRTLMHKGQNKGVEWLVIFFEEGPLVEEFAALGIDTRIVPVGRLREIGRFFTSIRALTRLFKIERVDVVLSWMSKAHLYGSLSALWAGCPALWYQHGLPSGHHPIDRLATLLPTTAVIACSERAATMQRRLWPHRPVVVAYPSVDLDAFDPSSLPSPRDARHQLGLPTDAPLIGMVGRLQRWKGMHVLIDALPKIHSSHPDAQVVIVGGEHDSEPEYPSILKKQIETLGLSDTVHLAGFQTNVPLWMQAMDIVVHASDHEPFGMVVIEAMALGKPVVAGAEGGPREIISADVNGIFAPYGDANALANQTLRFLSDPLFAKACGNAAYRRALNFSTDQYAANLTQLLQRLTSPRVAA